MCRLLSILPVLFAATAAVAGPLQPGGVQLLCHRTANEDLPENTLESLEQAALLGCNVVEIDLRRTLDGRIVLNHDGLASENTAVRERAIHIVAWQGDAEAIETLRNLQKTSPADAGTAAWAIDKIESMRPRVRKEGSGNPDLP